MRAQLGFVRGGIGILGCDATGSGEDCYPTDSTTLTFPYPTDGTPVSTPTGSNSGTTGSAGGFWDSISNIFTPIIKSQFPAIPAGSVLVQGPNGQTYIRYASGQQVPWTGTSVSGTVSGTGVVSGIGGSSLLMIAAVGLVALVALKK